LLAHAADRHRARRPETTFPPTTPRNERGEAMSIRRTLMAAGLAAAALALAAVTSSEGGDPVETPASSTHIVLSWNDLGMHCMNRSHANLSVLPPFNNLHAQVIRRGNSSDPPVIVTTGIALEYSIPGNTYSVGKTDFWNYDLALFGVDLPPNVGLTGNGLSGSMSLSGSQFIADGIPITPFTDAQPAVEDPYQQALVIARDAGGVELARSAPVIPVSTEMSCVSAGCHASESEILNEHEAVPGYDPDVRPILCASCHADPALGTPGNSEARYFSERMHDNHIFVDETIPGIAGCYKCHPGPNTMCLRGAMSQQWGLVCQDCHGTMVTMATSIENGRTPWLEEPSCRTCHTDRFGEPVGQLYRNSAGHGGVMCSGCHGSPHSEYPSRVARDNANNVALQGHAGVLTDCTVCHGTNIAGPGPHGFIATDVIESEILSRAEPLSIYPNPMRGECTIDVRLAAASTGGGRAGANLIVYDAEGRTVRLLHPEATGRETMRARWDGRNQRGGAVAQGTYFVRWQDGAQRAAGKVVVLN
jgi:hypothetical protein